MTPNEAKTRKRIKRNFKAQIDDVILYCKVNVEILSAMNGDSTESDIATCAIDAKIGAFRDVLKRLNVKPEATE